MTNTRQLLGAGLAALLTTTMAAAQGSQRAADLERASATRYAGVYHVATGTWTRGERTFRQFGLSDNLYSNTAASGYFSGAIGPTGAAAGGFIVDEGVIPSSTNPTAFALGGSARDVSSVTEVQVGYCDFDTNPNVAGFQLDFFEQYTPCTSPPGTGSLAGTVVLSGAPSNGCWVVDIDLTGATFELEHETGGMFTGSLLDFFGVAWSYTGTGSAAAGLQIAGDPQVTDTGWTVAAPTMTGSNTYFGEIGGCPGTGTGYQNTDFYWLEDVNSGLGTSGCFSFGGYRNVGTGCGGPLTGPYAGFWIEIRGEGEPAVISQPGCVGAINATGVPGQIEVSGDVDATVNVAELRAFDLPPGEFGIFATALFPFPPMVTNLGNGWLCLNQGAGLGVGRFFAPQQIKNSGATGEITLSTAAGEWDLSMIPGAVGSYAATAGLTSYFQCWHREANTGAGFNLTGSCSVTWR